MDVTEKKKNNKKKKNSEWTGCGLPLISEEFGVSAGDLAWVGLA